MKKIGIVVGLLACMHTNAQKIVKQDILGATYTIDNGEITKNFRDTTYSYKNILFGNITSADVVNPLQLILFYKQQNSIVILDNQLNAINNINFNKLEQPIQAIYAGLASQNQIWIYDISEKRFSLYNILQHKIKYITNYVNLNISWIASDLNNLYFLTDTNELYEVNLYGKITVLTKFSEEVNLSYFDKTFTVINKKLESKPEFLKLQRGKLVPLNP